MFYSLSIDEIISNDFGLRIDEKSFVKNLQEADPCHSAVGSVKYIEINFILSPFQKRLNINMKIFLLP